jgi:hypothetical protein
MTTIPAPLLGTTGADPSTSPGMTGKCRSLASLGMSSAVIPSERSESRDLHLVTQHAPNN